MMKSHVFQIELAPAARDDLKSIRAFESKKIVEGIRAYLTHEPTKTSR